MKYLYGKVLALGLVAVGALSQSEINPEDPQWGWDDFQQLKCEEGYNKVSNYCVRCDEEAGKFFDPMTKQCRECPPDTTYDPETKTCECPCLPPRQVNPETNQCECSGGRQFVDGQCQCPEEDPLWNGRKCVRCPEGTTFEPTDMQCYHCPEGFEADPATHQCEPAL